MLEVVLSVVVLAFFMGMMSIGVIMGRSPIKGSCGGMSAIGMKGACDICGGDTNRCESNTAGRKDAEGSHLAYEATQQTRDND